MLQAVKNTCKPAEFAEAPPGFEPGMADLQSTAFGRFLARFCRENRRPPARLTGRLTEKGYRTGLAVAKPPAPSLSQSAPASPPSMAGPAARHEQPVPLNVRTASRYP